MQKFKKQLAFLFGLIAMITYLSVRYFPEEEISVPVIQTEDKQNHMQVFLMDQDKTLVPISIAVNEELQEEDCITMMLGYMSGKQSIKGFQPVFQGEVQAKSITIEEGCVTLDFQDDFKKYDAQNELRVMEALTWGVTQFHDIERLKLKLNGEVLTTMPLAGTPIPEVLNRSIGINHFETGTSVLHDSNVMTVFYAKKIEGTTYMVPKSKRYASTRTSIESRVNEILEDISVSSTLTQPSVKESVTLNAIDLQDGYLKIDLNKNILGADQSVKQDVYDSLLLSFLSMEEVEKAEIFVDGVSVSAGDEKPVSLEDLTYNVVKF